MEWIIIDSLSGLEDADKQSFIGDVMIFKHSTSCPISHIAKRRLEEDWDGDMNSMMTYYLDLKSFRDISNIIAEKYMVHHESPQILIIRSGECIYDASHLDITSAEIKEILV